MELTFYKCQLVKEKTLNYKTDNTDISPATSPEAVYDLAKYLELHK